MYLSPSIILFLSSAAFTNSLSLPELGRRQQEQQPPQDHAFQETPTTAKPDNTFSNGGPYDNKGAANVQAGMDPGSYDPTYAARHIDLPYLRQFHGNMKFFQPGQLNSPDYISDDWAGTPGPGDPVTGSPNTGTDSASQSACGIPNNAYYDSHAAIHPYFLKYAPLARYCMQDVCISMWKEDGTADMIAKVTDICSTDPNDPSACATPSDIKVTKGKAFVLEGFSAQPGATIENTPQLQGAQYPEQIYWFFTNCWAESMVQSAYADNWFAQPPFLNNIHECQATANQSYLNNQVSYPNAGFETYPYGGYGPVPGANLDMPFGDWAPGDPDPDWSPVAGGKGYSGKF